MKKKFLCLVLVAVWAAGTPVVRAGEAAVEQPSAAITPDPAVVVDTLAESIKAPARTRRIVRQILDETNDSYLTLWAADVESYETGDAEGATPFETRARNWEKFYRESDRMIDYDRLAQDCIGEVYPRYFSAEELGELVSFLSNPTKTRADITVFAKTPLGRKYRAVLRRLSDETFLYLQHRVRSMIQSALKGEKSA